MAERGVFKVENLVFVATPNSNQRVLFVTDGINRGISENTLVPNSLSLQFDIRGCIEGEQMLSNGKCRDCPSGTYLLDAPETPTNCKTCKTDVSTCLGGRLVYPKAGYWRISNTTDNFLQCLNDEACLEGSSEAPMGACEKSYQGFMCASCQEGYSLNQINKKCEQCPSPAQNSLILVGFLIVFLAVIVILVRSNLNSSASEKNYLPVFLRILVNHLQVLTLAASLDFSWPKQLSSFFSAFRPVSESQSQLFSIDCFIQGKQISQVYTARVGALASIPMLLVLASVLVWVLLHSAGLAYKSLIQDQTVKIREISLFPAKIKRRSIQIEDLTIGNDISQVQQYDVTSQNTSQNKLQQSQETSFMGKIVSTIVVLLFLIHPTITREMFTVFNCIQMEGENRLYTDLEVKCYEGSHFVVAYGVALPSLIIYSLGIPLLGLYIIFKYRNQLEKLHVRQMYGFLYNGYRPGYARYWEIFIVYRKLALVFIQIFLLQNGKVTQSLVTLLYLWAIMIMVKVLQPYQKSYLNQLEFLSLLTLCISIYFCVYFVSGPLQVIDETSMYQEKQAHLWMFLIVIAMQITFFACWSYWFLQEFKYTIKTKYPRIYIMVFTCCKERKFFAEKDLENYRRRVIEPLLDKIDSVQGYIAKEKNIYRKDMVPLYDQDIREALGKFLDFKSSIESLEKMYSQKALLQRVEDLVLMEKANQFHPSSSVSQQTSKDLNQSLKSFSSSVIIDNGGMLRHINSHLDKKHFSPMVGQASKFKNKKIIKSGISQIHGLDLEEGKTILAAKNMEDSQNEELLNDSIIMKEDYFYQRSKYPENSQTQAEGDSQADQSGVLVLKKRQKASNRKKRRDQLPSIVNIQEKTLFNRKLNVPDQPFSQEKQLMKPRLRQSKTRAINAIENQQTQSEVIQGKNRTEALNDASLGNQEIRPSNRYENHLYDSIEYSSQGEQ